MFDIQYLKLQFLKITFIKIGFVKKNKITQTFFDFSIQMQKSFKNSPQKVLEQIKKRRQTINITESEYNLPQKMKSPKTYKKQYYIVKDLKTSNKYQKSNHILYTEAKKSQRVNSLTPYETDLTPKKLLFYHDDPYLKQKCQRKIHSISLVDTPKKLNLKKKTQQHLFTVNQKKDKQSCKKILSSNKFSNKNLVRPLKLQSGKLHDSIQQQDTTPSSYLKSSKKTYSKNYQNYDIYYNEGEITSSTNLKSSKKMTSQQDQYNTQASNHGLQKQKSSSRTLRITRNSRSSNHNNHLSGNNSGANNISNQNQGSSKNNIKSQKGIKSSRIDSKQFCSPNSSKLNEKKYEKMFLKCSLVLKKYNTELQKLKGENDSLKKQNEYLKSSLSHRAL